MARPRPLRSIGVSGKMTRLRSKVVCGIGKSTWRLVTGVRVALRIVSVQYEARTSRSQKYLNDWGKGSGGIGQINGEMIAGCDGRGAKLVAVPHR